MFIKYTSYYDEKCLFVNEKYWLFLTTTANIFAVRMEIDAIHNIVVKNGGKVVIFDTQTNNIKFSIDGGYDLYQRLLVNLNDERSSAGLEPIAV
jgi:hypothetical protein